MDQFLVLLIPACILWSWLSPIGFTSRTVEGAVVRIMSLPLLSRLKRHAFPIVLTSIVSLALIITGPASSWWLVAVLLSAIGLLSVPQSYVVTTRGIRVGSGNFRRWTEFAGVYRSPAGARLQAIRRVPDMPIWLSGSREDDEFVHLLKTLVRDSYKGKTTQMPMPHGHQSTRHEGPDIPDIAAFTHDR